MKGPNHQNGMRALESIMYTTNVKSITRKGSHHQNGMRALKSIMYTTNVKSITRKSPHHQNPQALDFAISVSVL